MTMQKIIDLYKWLSFRDYYEAMQAATDAVIRRYARGNTLVQNGGFLDEQALRVLSLRGDRALTNLLSISRL